MAQRGSRGDGFGTSVISCEASRIARVPIAKLAAAHAARRCTELLATATRPANGEETRSRIQRLISSLQLESAFRALLSEIRPDQSCFLSPDTARLPSPDVLLAVAKASGRWSRRGTAEVRQRAGRLAPEQRRAATGRAEEYVKAVCRQARSVPQSAALLRETLDVLADRQSEVQRQLETLAATDHDRVHRTAVEQLQTSRWGRRSRLRHAAVQTHNAVVEATCKEAALRLHLEHFLTPMITVLTSHLDRLVELEGDMDTIHQQIELELECARAEIGYETEFFSDVIAPEEVQRVLDQLAEQMRGTPGQTDELELAPLLACRGSVQLQAMLDEVADKARQHVESYLTRTTKDIRGFINAFGLGFDLDEWLADSMQLTLPARLNLAVVPPGCCPLRTYIIAAGEDAGVSAAISRFGADLSVELRAGDPFQVLVCAKISRAPFASIPGLVEIERAYHRFLETAPTDHIWGTLVSHLEAFKEAPAVFFGWQPAAEVEAPTAAEVAA